MQHSLLALFPGRFFFNRTKLKNRPGEDCIWVWLEFALFWRILMSGKTKRVCMGIYSVKAAVISKISPCYNNLVTKTKAKAASRCLGQTRRPHSLSIKSKLSISCEGIASSPRPLSPKEVGVVTTACTCAYLRYQGALDNNVYGQ